MTLSLSQTFHSSCYGSIHIPHRYSIHTHYLTEMNSLNPSVTKSKVISSSRITTNYPDHLQVHQVPRETFTLLHGLNDIYTRFLAGKQVNLIQSLIITFFFIGPLLLSLYYMRPKEGQSLII